MATYPVGDSELSRDQLEELNAMLDSGGWEIWKSMLRDMQVTDVEGTYGKPYAYDQRPLYQMAHGAFLNIERQLQAAGQVKDAYKEVLEIERGHK